MEALDITGFEPLLLTYFSSVVFAYFPAVRRASIRRIALLRFLAILCGMYIKMFLKSTFFFSFLYSELELVIL